MGTIFSIILAAATVLLSRMQGDGQPLPLPPAFGYFAFALAITLFLILAAAFASLQKAEQNLTPRILELFQKDHRISWIARGIILLTLLMLFLSYYPVPWPLPLSPLAAGIILLGITFDLLHGLVNKILNYLNPYPVAKMFTKVAEKSIHENREIDLCESLESLSEISLKSVSRSGSSLCNQCLDEMREIMRLFLDSTKTIANAGPDEQAQSRGITDKVSYTLFFFFDRLDMIYQKAISMGLTQICSSIVTLLGKVCIYAAQCDLSLVGYVVDNIGKFCIMAEKKKLPEISLRGTCTLTEASKTIVKEIPLAYMDLKDPFFSIINQLNEIGKEAFRQNKQSSIALLSAPFQDLKMLFQSPKVADHPDTPAILAEIERVMAEWTTLETVLRTIPPMMTTSVLEDKESGA